MPFRGEQDLRLDCPVLTAQPPPAVRRRVEFGRAGRVLGEVPNPLPDERDLPPRSATGSSCSTLGVNRRPATASSQDWKSPVTSRRPLSVSGHGPLGAGTGPPTASWAGAPLAVPDRDRSSSSSILIASGWAGA
jgi:hypothetical protein